MFILRFCHLLFISMNIFETVLNDKWVFIKTFSRVLSCYIYEAVSYMKSFFFFFLEKRSCRIHGADTFRFTIGILMMVTHFFHSWSCYLSEIRTVASIKCVWKETCCRVTILKSFASSQNYRSHIHIYTYIYKINITKFGKNPH